MFKMELARGSMVFRSLDGFQFYVAVNAMDLSLIRVLVILLPLKFCLIGASNINDCIRYSIVYSLLASNGYTRFLKIPIYYNIISILHVYFEEMHS